MAIGHVGRSEGHVGGLKQILKQEGWGNPSWNAHGCPRKAQKPLEQMAGRIASRAGNGSSSPLGTLQELRRLGARPKQIILLSKTAPHGILSFGDQMTGRVPEYGLDFVAG